MIKIKPSPIREYWRDKSSDSINAFAGPNAENERKPLIMRAIPSIKPINWFMKFYLGTRIMD